MRARARETLLNPRARRRRQRAAIGQAKPAEAGQLDARMAQIKPGHQAEEIELDTLHPSSLDAEQPVERLYREVRLDRIWEGTSEIQRLIIANELNKRGLSGLLSFMNVAEG